MVSAFFTSVILIPLFAAVVLYHLETFDPAPLPEHELTQKGQPFSVPTKNSQMLLGSERIGSGELPGPEDIAYDPKTGVVYTGCEDGWIRRVTLTDSAADSVVENWVNTGGRPLGLAHGLHGDVIVADAHKVGFLFKFEFRYTLKRMFKYNKSPVATCKFLK